MEIRDQSDDFHALIFLGILIILFIKKSYINSKRTIIDLKQIGFK